jgi:wobble nucleotide-excising tRNase
VIDSLKLLRNIGQFDSVSSAANIPLARLTVVYSENGRGKTTLAAVLRSLATGDPMPIAERRRLAAQHPPHVILKCSGGPPDAIFENNAWNRTLPALVVFDDVFVEENVNSGLAVQAHHRQNLHELILGAQAEGLSRRLVALVTQIEVHNTALRAKERALPAADRGEFTADEFCALPARPEIDQAILEAERSLAAALVQDAIRATLPFDLLTLPTFDLAAIAQILAQDLPALDVATLARVQTHLDDLGQGGEPWVAEGMRRIPSGQGSAAPETCPFCAQNLQSSPVIQHYRAYFSDAYAALKRMVSDALGAVIRAHGGDVPARFERAVRICIERRQFWSRFCEVAELIVDTAAIVRDWRAAREAVQSQLVAKQAAPLERVDLADETQLAVAVYEAHRHTITTLNQRLKEANDAVGVSKERAAIANSTLLRADLARLKAIKARYAPATAALCDEYLVERMAKEETEQVRDQAKAELDQYKTTVFPAYQTAINIYLPKFNADFRLDGVMSSNTRFGPTCTYSIVINKTPVSIGGADATLGEPSFRNTLSAGDRNTLALAFFFASLDQDRELADKVVVIDDPISSLDDHRALTTVQEIRSLAGHTAQLIVLSHNKPFLCRLWEGADPDARAALEVVREGAGSTLRPWDVSQDSITEHDRRHARLREFFASNSGDKQEVARSIRPHLEAFLRVACPENFEPGALLGPFIGVCEQRVGTDREILDSVCIQELRDINEYASRYHHQGWETEPINGGELRGFVERALRFARR